LSLLLLPSGGIVLAQAAAGLYQVQVPVAGQQADQRSQAISDAFVKVLVRVSGNRRIVSRGDLSGEVANASRYVQEYSYRTESEQERYLDVTFDAQAVDRLLRSRGLPVWGGSKRPAILVWMAAESQGKRRLLVPDRDTPVHTAMASAARERGLPLLSPLMDLEDQGRLQVADLWGDFEVNIRAASRRYSPDMILTGRMMRANKGMWRGQWQLYQERSKANWNNQGKSPGAVAADAVQHVADLLANRFAPLATRDPGQNLVRLKVSGVYTLEDYAAVERALASQAGAERITVATVEPSAVVYELRSGAGLEVLEQRLAAGGLLEPDLDAGIGFEGTDSWEPVQPDADLYFRVR
jgi:hypothetical protein